MTTTFPSRRLEKPGTGTSLYFFARLLAEAEEGAELCLVQRSEVARVDLTFAVCQVRLSEPSRAWGQVLSGFETEAWEVMLLQTSYRLHDWPGSAGQTREG